MKARNFIFDGCETGFAQISEHPKSLIVCVIEEQQALDLESTSALFGSL